MIVKIMMLMICLNTGLGVMHWYADGNGEVGLASALQPNALPSMYNATAPANGGDYIINLEDENTSIGQMRNPMNTTNTYTGTNELDAVQDSLEFALVQPAMLLNWFSGGFVFGTIDNFTGAIGVELPPYLIEGFMAMYGVGLLLMGFYAITGRGFSGFT